MYNIKLNEDLLHNPNISDCAKLLFIEIQHQIDVNKYCTLCNAEFAKMLNTSEKTVSNRLGELEKFGYIFRQIVYNEFNGSIDKRYITTNKEDLEQIIANCNITRTVKIKRPNNNNRATDLISKELRYKIFARDGFKCKCCGRTVEDGIRLEIDHIIPYSKGGTSDESNLQTLCNLCNLGKLDHIF